MSAQIEQSFSSAIPAEQMSITPAAGEQLAELFGQVEDEEIEAVRIYVSGGGCGGMQYGMTFTDRRSGYDRVFDGQGFRLYVDAVALQYVKGVEIDYVTSETGATFVFNNVFEATGGSGVCGGCGMAGGGGGCG